jgi:hypothetical protein
MKLLITSWRQSFGYTLPFFWVQIHGWGQGGGGSDTVCFWGGGPEVLHSLLHTTHYTLHTTHYTLHTTHYTLHTTHYTLHTAHCTLHTTHYTLHTTHYTLLHSLRTFTARTAHIYCTHSLSTLYSLTAGIRHGLSVRDPPRSR